MNKYVEGLESEKRYLKMEVSSKDKCINDLQQIIGKAIEYIELKRGKNKSSYDCEILKILRGEDNEI